MLEEQVYIVEPRKTESRLRAVFSLSCSWCLNCSKPNTKDYIKVSVEESRARTLFLEVVEEQVMDFLNSMGYIKILAEERCRARTLILEMVGASGVDLWHFQNIMSYTKILSEEERWARTVLPEEVGKPVESVFLNFKGYIKILTEEVSWARTQFLEVVGASVVDL